MTTTSWIITVIIVLLVIGGIIYWANTGQPTPVVENPSSSSSSSSSSGTGQTSSVKVGTSQALGQYLTDADGIALYRYAKDADDKSNCTGTCLNTWLPFYASQMNVSSPLNQSDFGEITRDDGTKQATYKRQPLYYYSQDQQQGDTKGDKKDNEWFVVKP